nr:GntR family transcriptional regulator [uncultured Sphaerochaeta sp.]
MQKTTIPLSKRYLSDEVSNVIKEQIFNLQYHRGERLIVESLASQLGVSMTPVREGLKLLVGQGIVVYDGKSYAVFNPSRKEIQDIFSIRRYLEKLSAFAATERLTAEKLDALYTLQYHWGEQSDVDLRQFIAFDIEFHTLLAKSSENERLLLMSLPINEQCHLLRLWSYEHNFPKENLAKTVEEHISILDAMKIGDAKKAEQLMDKHLLKGEQIAWKMYDNFYSEVKV